ncbi:MAG: serine/threonine-protein kinase [Deltaproteobacteria bacterium]
MRRFGRYTLVKKLATGGMAEIWLARQRGLAGFNRFVVIKKILSHLSEQDTFVKMFLDEARTSAQLNHPNVVQIYDLGREGDSYYIAMEFIAGENLAAIAWRGMKRGKPFPPSFAARVIADGCKALHYAHHLKGSDGQALEIVHRDISPQNILVTYEGEVKVVDFGIAKAATKSETTKTGMLKGKFSYMSPEQCLGAHVDMRSDIFALGILLYELCTGKRLFKHESELMILEMITKRSVVPPSQVAPGISSGLEDIIMRALEKDVSSRFATAQEMQIALEEYLRDEGHQAANADVASYMRELFSDKIEEKRRLREIASRDDFEASFGDEEATEQAVGNRALGATGNRRVVQGMSPSAMRPMTATGQQPFPGATGSGSIPPGMASQSGMMHPGMTPPGYHPGATPSQMGMQYSGQYPYPPGTYSQVQPDQGGGWVARVVIAGALIVILVASFILYQQLTPQTQTMPAPPPITRGPQQTGSLTLESVPVGATIYLDGKPMRLPNGENAKTPSDLHSLQYGVTYRIRLSKEGYKPYEETIEMGEPTDSKTVRPELEAFPGKLIANVTGDDRTNVRVMFNGKDMGLGPRIEKQLPGHEDVLISAELPRHTCSADPVRVTVKPNETVETTIRCRKRTRRPPPPPPPPGGGGTTRRNPPPPPPPSGSGGCVVNSNLSPGYATINTTPYAEVYWGKRKLGQTPIARVQLPAGCIKIRAVSLDGSKTRTVQIKVEPNEVAIYQFKLEG